MEKDLIEAKKYLSQQGYGSGTNYNTNLVAVLLSNYAQEQVNKLNKPDVSNSVFSEPDFRRQKGEWIVWNMLEYGNSLETSCELLRQKEIVDRL